MSPRTYSESTSDNSYTGRPSREMSLYQCSMSSSETNKYRLRMWVDEEYNPQGDGGSLSFSVQINVYGKDGNPEDLYKTIADTLLTEISEDNLYVDGVDTFITGEDPNNYIWYSGKLWRAVSINNEAKTTKLVTQWNISAIHYSDENSKLLYDESYIKEWLNDESVDGFLGNLREPEKFIKMDSKWNATLTTSTSKPEKTTIIEDPVGLLNVYEYTMSYKGTNYSNGYLNNGLSWWTLTMDNSNVVRIVTYTGSIDTTTGDFNGIRPSINLKSDVKIVSGSGTVDDPYRLNGDDDVDLKGVKLNTRYSGEYIRFGSGENNLYRIVSHETKNLTKIVSNLPLKDSGTFKLINFGNNKTFSSTNTIGAFLNGDYLTKYVDNYHTNMIEDETTWYLGEIGQNTNSSYKLAKYASNNDNILTSKIAQVKVGLLRYGELLSGQFERYVIKGGTSSTKLTTDYWTLTPEYSSSKVFRVRNHGAINSSIPNSYPLGIKPALNLKENVIITSGDGTKNNPFQLSIE